MITIAIAISGWLAGTFAGPVGRLLEATERNRIVGHRADARPSQRALPEPLGQNVLGPTACQFALKFRNLSSGRLFNMNKELVRPADAQLNRLMSLIPVADDVDNIFLRSAIIHPKLQQHGVVWIAFVFKSADQIQQGPVDPSTTAFSPSVAVPP